MFTPLHDAGTFLLQLPTPSQANLIFCFVLTVNFPDFTTVVIKGNFEFKGANTINDVMLPTKTVSIFTPKQTSIDAEDNKFKTLIVVTTLCVLFIILTTLVIISIVIVILRRRRKWRSGLSNQASNIYE